MQIVPVGPGFAAELRGVTLAEVAHDDAAYAAVRAAFEEHSVLVFRGQDVTDEVQLAFSRRFGDAGDHQGRLARHGHPFRHPHHHRPRRQSGAARLAPRAAQQGQPALAHRLIVQARAGAHLDPVGAHRSGRGRRDRIRLDAAGLRAARSRLAGASWKIPSPGTTTPIRAARSRPVSPRLRSARRCRRCAGAWCGRTRRTAARRFILPRTPMRSRAWRRRPARKLIDELMAAATAPGASYEHQWRAGDVVMWDNRATMHRGRPWPPDQARLMVRTTISASAADGVESMRPPGQQAAE